MKKKIVYIDMDDTIADFIGSERLFVIGIRADTWPASPSAMYQKGFFRELNPIDGAKEALRKLLSCEHLDIHILTKPVFDSPHSYSEKAEWIAEHFPELVSKIVMSQRKELCHGHFLVDDHIGWKESWELATGGEYIHFNPRSDRKRQWNEIAEYILKKVTSEQRK